jgi:hypothetical protein
VHPELHRHGQDVYCHQIRSRATDARLKWKEAGSEKPSKGTEIKNELLAAALEHKVLAVEPLEFKKEELFE